MYVPILKVVIKHNLKNAYTLDPVPIYYIIIPTTKL